MITKSEIQVQSEGEKAIVYAGDYINKLSGEKIERECKQKLDAGAKTLVVNFSDTEIINKLSGEKIERECKQKLDAGAKTLVVNFSDTEIVNSIGVSILLGVIDTASDAGAKVVFSDVRDETIELFEMLGLTNHVTLN